MVEVEDVVVVGVVVEVVLDVVEVVVLVLVDDVVELVDVGDVPVEEVVLEEALVEEVDVGVDVVEVVVEVVAEVVVVDGLAGPPSQDGFTAPGEKATPGPDCGGGNRVGTDRWSAPRYQVVESESDEGVAEIDDAPADDRRAS